MEEFTNENIDLNKLPHYQEITLTAPHPNYWKVILINIFIFLFLTGAGLTLFLIFNDEVKPQRLFIIGAYLIIVILIFVLYRASFKKRGFALREKDIIYKSGIIAETTTIVPLNRIQHVALDEGIFSRIFKLGKLQIFTAGGQSGHLHIGGIEIEKARSIKEMLLRKLDQIETLAENQ
ncbi:PH domain-containing protein [Pedobacter sp. LMG 31464]|uniref:PH domain-containing protein n=1 Tax=Pedobacter planticolens TaxID=2679964 RepID=A0A923DWL8_9SPHI|nr:PH domain-containing protein [Pedobacter planticolens]MBB2145341.1 PH domain-containing protein [Pedobacter planticolens]